MEGSRTKQKNARHALRYSTTFNSFKAIPEVTEEEAKAILERFKISHPNLYKTLTNLKQSNKE